jgi:hypothetical protein
MEKEFKGTKTKKGELKWIRSGMGFQVLTADSYYSICEAVGKKSQEEQIANAQLIAVAPELLKFAMYIAKHEKGSAPSSGYFQEMIERAEKVINKALG